MALASGLGLSLLAAETSVATDGARTSAAATQAVEMDVPLSGVRARFRVETPDGPSSAAARDDRALTRADGTSVGWTSGYTLTARVIVRAMDQKSVATAAGNANVNITSADRDGHGGALSEFFYVDAASVRDAIALANAMTLGGGGGGGAGIREAYLDVDSPKVLRNNIPTDPGVPLQWHLINSVNPSADINVEPSWKAGLTGAGITVGVLESGWDITHEDLAANYDAAASQPAAGSVDHGTATAGLVAAVANNARGGAGVAYGAKVSRLYYGSSSQIADAFGFRNDLNKIKTNSWGPFDNGFIATISSVELAGFEDAVTTGRGGLGEVIVWAAGNGGQNNDRVDYDPYGSNRFSMAVGSIDSQDRHSLYSEPGSSLMLVTTSDYDLISTADVGIYSSWGFNTYTTTFGGTSSASPIAAGVAALVLQANPNLGWRDVQHVMIRSARRVNPADPSWGFNGAGAGNMRAWSEIYGFGAIDAGAATALAPTWVNRPAQGVFAGPVVSVNQSIPDNNLTGVSSGVSVASPLIVERVQITLNAPHTRIGQLRITLTSPSGTVATLATLRSDNTSGGYSNFTFSPARFWDERAAGTWTLKVADEVASPLATGSITNWQLKIFGYTPACPCDWNLSGDVSLQDLFDYLTSYFNGRGDFAGDGAATVQDLFDFLGCWFGGC
jgi:subtilisin-like proprotein convertase family protein